MTESITSLRKRTGTMPLRMQIGLAISLLAAAFGAVVALYYPAAQRANEMRALDSELNSIHALTGSLVGPAMVFADTGTIEQTIGYVLQNPSAGFVVVYDDTGTVMASAARPGLEPQLEAYQAVTDSSLFHSQQLLIRDQVIQSETGEVGRLVIAFSTARAEENAQRSVQVSMGIALAFVLVGIAVALLISLRLVGPLTELSQSFVALSQGHIGDEVRERGAREFGALARAFNRTAEVLRDVFTRLTHASEGLGRAVRETQLTSDVVTKSTDSLGRSVADVGTNVEEIAAQIQTVADNSDALSKGLDEAAQEVGAVQRGAMDMRDQSGALAQQFDQLSQTMLRLMEDVGTMAREIGNWQSSATSIVADAQSGKQLISSIVESVQQSQDVFRLIREQFDTLAVDMRQTTTVIASLQAISDRTHILALNASIEAARAGAAGKGFNVIAQEIRKLAGQSVETIRRVEQSVSSAVQRSAEVSDVVGRNAKRAESGVVAIQSTTQQLERIVVGVQQVLSLTASLAQVVSSQDQGMRKIQTTVLGILEYSERVRSTSDKQFRETDSIATTIKSLASLGAGIREATSEQYNGAQLILRTVQTIDGAARDLNETVRNLEGTVHFLVEQQRALRDASAFFAAEAPNAERGAS